MPATVRDILSSAVSSDWPIHAISSSPLKLQPAGEVTVGDPEQELASCAGSGRPMRRAMSQLLTKAAISPSSSRAALISRATVWRPATTTPCRARAAASVAVFIGREGSGQVW